MSIKNLRILCVCADENMSWEFLVIQEEAEGGERRHKLYEGDNGTGRHNGDYW